MCSAMTWLLINFHYKTILTQTECKLVPAHLFLFCENFRDISVLTHSHLVIGACMLNQGKTVQHDKHGCNLEDKWLAIKSAHLLKVILL